MTEYQIQSQTALYAGIQATYIEMYRHKADLSYDPCHKEEMGTEMHCENW